MGDEDLLDFNFWPSFADLMLSLVLILLLVMFLFVGIKSIGTVNLEAVHRNQMNLIKLVADSYNVKEKEIDKQTYRITLELDKTKNSTFDIEFRNEPALQRITFSDRILFSPDDFKLNENGEIVLKQVGKAIEIQLPNIKEIQIQGHADTDATKRFPSNVHLASLRAIEVFKFLEENVGISPAEHLMSATSFGEFKPVQRNNSEEQYNELRLKADNEKPELKAKNRRIELLLFYRVNK